MFANGKFRWWHDEEISKLEGYALNKNNFENKQLRNLQTFFEQRGKYTLRHMKDFLKLNGEFVKLTVLIEGKGKIKINSIIPVNETGKWTGQYFSGVPITISVITDNNYEFKGWDGDISSEEKSITVTLKEAMTIKANFYLRKSD